MSGNTYHESVAESIFKRMRESKAILLSPSAHEDLLQIAYDAHGSDIKLAHSLNVHARKALMDAMKHGTDADMLYDIYKRSLLMDAPNYLDEFKLYMESDRPIEERFYQNRRGTLKQITDMVQALHDDELDEGAISLPPRTGKTTDVAMDVAWLMGGRPNNPNLYSSYSDTITNAFFNAVLEFITDDVTYKYADVFPNAKNVKTNAAEETIDFGMKRRYSSLTCRSIDGTLNGACDVSGGFLIADDLVSGIEEALSKDRLAKKQAKVNNDLLSRAKSTTKILWIGTRWSLFDPIGLRINFLEERINEGERRFRIINIPALNENDESNFDYPYKVGFTTADYHQKRDNFEQIGDTASWQAQYMGEPMDREGTIFKANQFSYYMGTLPQEEPDRKFMAVDPAFGGGDFVAAPIVYQYGKRLYVPDVVYNNGDKRVTQKQLAVMAQKYGITVMQIECNKATESYAEGVQKELDAIKYSCTVTTKNSSSQIQKSARILDKAPDIRERYVFLSAPQRPSKEYDAFLKNVWAYSPFLDKSGLRKQHDDAPDSLAQGIEFTETDAISVFIFKSPLK